MKKWAPILILAAAQFVMVLDTSVMNVAITDVVEDLDTSVSQVQLAITLYTLVMAALMLTGGKLGDILGRRRVFSIGLMIYGTGSLTTALAPNIDVLLLGWSGLEGVGAALVIPAIASLIAGNYKGTDRALAYGIIGGMAAAGVAAGPLIGGWVTEEFSWRYVFAGEVAVIAAILLTVRAIRDVPRPETPPRLDLAGSALSAVGMALIVLGVLKIPEWGLVEPKGALTIGGTEITPFGFSAVPFMITAGVVVMGLFATWIERRERLGQEPLIRRDLFRVEQLRAGLTMLGSQQLILMGIFFVLPLYLQVVLGKNAFETGIAILPISVTMFVSALTGPRLATRFSPRRIVQVGLLGMLGASVVLMATIDFEVNRTGFLVGLALFGLGVGLLASQLGNIIMSSVDSSRASEAGGLQGTAQQFGASLGTALIGGVLLAGLASSTGDAVAGNPNISAAVEQQVVAVTEKGVDFVPHDQVERAVKDAGASEGEAKAIADAYASAQILALKEAMAAAAMFTLIGFWFSRRLPRRRLGEADEPPPTQTAAPAA